MLLYLQSWWSRTYNRPLKDPLLESYTIEDLLYEFYDRIERKLAEEEALNLEADKIEDDKEKQVLDWAEAEEAKEMEELKKKSSKVTKATSETKDPRLDPRNVKWMEKQLEEGRKIHGETFGTDIDESFEDA